MNKKTYLESLKKEIAALPSEEQDAALHYYTDYFEDAGFENEQKVIEELGSPEEQGAFIRSRFSCVPAKVVKKNEGSKNTFQFQKVKNEKNPSTSKNILIVLLILLLTIPIWAPIFFSILGIFIAIITVILSLGFAGLIAGIAVLCAGGGIIVSSFLNFAFSPINSVLVLGLGLLLIGIGFVIGVFGLWFCTKALPVIIRFIVSVLKIPFDKRRSK